jgi:hypothetical protein
MRKFYRSPCIFKRKTMRVVLYAVLLGSAEVAGVKGWNLISRFFGSTAGAPEPATTNLEDFKASVKSVESVDGADEGAAKTLIDVKNDLAYHNVHAMSSGRLAHAAEAVANIETENKKLNELKEQLLNEVEVLSGKSLRSFKRNWLQRRLLRGETGDRSKYYPMEKEEDREWYLGNTKSTTVAGKSSGSGKRLHRSKSSGNLPVARARSNSWGGTSHASAEEHEAESHLEEESEKEPSSLAPPISDDKQLKYLTIMLNSLASSPEKASSSSHRTGNNSRFMSVTGGENDKKQSEANGHKTEVVV